MEGNNRDEITIIAVLVALIAGFGVVTSVGNLAPDSSKSEAPSEVKIAEDEVLIHFDIFSSQIIEISDGRTFAQGSSLITKKGEKISGTIRGDGCSPKSIEIDAGLDSEKIYRYDSGDGTGKICPEDKDLLKTGVYLAKSEDATEDILNAALAEGELVILDVKNSFEEKAPSEDDLKDLPLSGALNEISENED